MANELRVQAIIAEYSALKAEIHGRSRDQLLCVSATLGAAGALLGVVVTNPDKFSSLLLIVPWLLGVLGMLWCDYARGIYQTALYVREEIEQKKLPDTDIFGKASPPTTIGWETHIHDLRQKNRVLGAINYLLPGIFFLLPSIGTLVGYYWIRFTTGTGLHLALEVVLTVLGGGSLVVMVLMWRQARKAYNAQMNNPG